MSRIYFDSDRAWAQLISIGTVATLRPVTGTKQYRGRLAVFRNGKNTGLRVRGKNARYLRLGSHPASVYITLEEYLPISGFDTVGDWVKAAHQLSGPMHEEWGLWIMELLGIDE